MGEGPLQRALDVLFPPRCVSCRGAGGPLCAACLARIERVEPPFCDRCGQTLADATCTNGQVHRSLEPLVGVRVAAHYRGVTRSAVRALKYSGQRRVAVPLGQMLAATYHAAGWEADVIVPLPLHPKRLASRGYNQSLLLARALGAAVGIPVADDVLERWRETAPQVGLGASERRENVANAFRLREGASTGSGARVAGRRVLLIDDVTTTGSTLGAAAQALLSAQAQAIWGLAVARPQLGQDA